MKSRSWQRANHDTPHLSASCYRHFTRGGPQVRTASARFTCENHSQEGGRAGWFAKRCHSITDHRINCKLKTKIASTILLLCYLNKICLTLTGGLWQASANLYCGGRLLKGAEASGQPLVDYTAFYRQHLCEEGSRPQQHTSNSKALFFFPLKLLLHIVYIFNILCGLEVINSRHLQ